MTETRSLDNSWLVIIDMQNIFSQGRWGCPKFNDIIEPIQKLAAKYGDRTIITRFVAGSDHQGSWKPYYKEFPFAEVPDSDELYCVVDSLGYLIRDDNVVTMTTFSKWGDEFNGVRAKSGKYPHLVLVGVATDCCVLSTAMSAAEAGAFVTVVSDGCVGSSDDNHMAAIAILAGYAPLVELKTHQELLKG